MEGEHHPTRFKFVRDRVGMYFAKHALDHGLQHVSETTIKSFLGAKDPAERARLGNLLLRQSVDVAVEPVVPVMAEIQEMAPVHLEPVDLRNLVHRFFMRARFGAYHDAISQRLAALQLA